MQSDQSIMDALTALIPSLATNIPMGNIPPLNFTFPTGQDLDAKWKEFLQRASTDPDIINYYQKLLTQAQGDTETAKQFLEKDYQMGTRQISENLGATLQKLGLQSTQEQQQEAAGLNQRGIAMTDLGGGKLGYAQGGQAATELGQLNQAQQLRKEAEQRSATQGVQSLGLQREKGLTSANQGLRNYAENLNQQRSQDILNRANTYYGVYQNKQMADYYKKAQQQQMGGGGSSDDYRQYQYLQAVGKDMNPAQQTQYKQLQTQFG